MCKAIEDMRNEAALEARLDEKKTWHTDFLKWVEWHWIK